MAAKVSAPNWNPTHWSAKSLYTRYREPDQAKKTGRTPTKQSRITKNIKQAHNMDRQNTVLTRNAEQSWGHATTWNTNMKQVRYNWTKATSTCSVKQTRTLNTQILYKPWQLQSQTPTGSDVQNEEDPTDKRAPGRPGGRTITGRRFLFVIWINDMKPGLNAENVLHIRSRCMESKSRLHNA